MTIKFCCPNGHKLKVDDIHGGKTSKCPTCREYATAPTVEAYALTTELSEIEAVINELEEKIKDGRHSVATVKQRNLAILGVVAANAGDQEWIEKNDGDQGWIEKEVRRAGELDTIDINRLYELRDKHPNDSRIIQLVYKAADCNMKLGKIHLTVGEEMGWISSDQKRELLEDGEKTMSLLFPR